MCSVIELAGQAFSESIQITRTLTVTGVSGSLVTGAVVVSGPGVVATLQRFRAESGCSPATLSVESGARVLPQDMEVAFLSAAPCPTAGQFFADGFEDLDS